MFRKLKDKLAEEVKSSPQRIQQFAQAAQAAVTSASSSISDITNNDLFSIGESDRQQNRLPKFQTPNKSKSSFETVSSVSPESSLTNTESDDYLSLHDATETPRQRKLSNSSFASDVSFRLPTYESPTMYHLQSDMEISASEADERGFSSGAVSLDRVTKEQIYGAYRRTQDRYTKYRTQYADLARHYKLLERENAKAKSVLVETQDKALRRISELREQCALEQSAKAHLEKALRVEIEEKNLKINTLYTKINLLQHNPDAAPETESEDYVKLINVTDTGFNNLKYTQMSNEILLLNNKIEKLEHLVNKYKESLKTTKEKNSQLSSELQKLSSELENKNTEIHEFKIAADNITASNNRIQELNDLNEDLQNEIKSLNFYKSKELSTHEIDFQKVLNENVQLKSQIEVFTKREEEYAISLAENKLSIHKELDNKENEIKTLKSSLSTNIKEIQSLNIVLSDYKNSISLLEEEQSKLISEINELHLARSKIIKLEMDIQTLSQKYQVLENVKVKAEEEYKCLQLQLKQETAEKMAMIDRNEYLQNKNTQLAEENSKKSFQLTAIEKELQLLKKDQEDSTEEKLFDKTKLLDEIDVWKDKYNALELEIQEERVELVKLQTEIEKLLTNYELVQMQNTEINSILADLKSENVKLQKKIIDGKAFQIQCKTLVDQVQVLKQCLLTVSKNIKLMQKNNTDEVNKIKLHLNILFDNQNAYEVRILAANESKSDTEIELKQLKERYSNISNQLNMTNDQYNKKGLDIRALEHERKLNHETIQSLREQLENTTKQLNHIKKDKENLSKLIEESSNKLQHDQNILVVEKEQLHVLKQENVKLLECLETVKNEKASLKKETDTLKKNLEETSITSGTTTTKANDTLRKISEESDEKQKVIERPQENVLGLEDAKLSLNMEVELLRKKLNELSLAFETIKEENNLLIIETRNSEDKNLVIAKLNNDIETLSHENVTLKSQFGKITESLSGLELELNDVRTSHAEIEIEKDRLSSIVEQKELKHITASCIDGQSQTDKCDIQGDEIINDLAELHTPKSNEAFLKQSAYAMNKPNEEDISLKEENRRLRSDIAGLQSYLINISKENSVLNDKLREYIASSVHSPYQNKNLSQGSANLNSNNLHSQNVQIEDLIRENKLLVEENLELKDQVKSQNYKLPDIKLEERKASENIMLNKKYIDLLNTNQNMQGRLNYLEQMNSNMSEVQENNNKLKKTNEKLERRLDEALVSLRHLHSLQENTELEYLRNILYEYLTGTGTHSLTLAKVLAAVVKFNDVQTKEVIQKEQERQGFLRQLGLI